MIGSGLKKYAVENGMKVAKGVAYGSLCGFATTMFEGSGFKQLEISTKFPTPGNMGEFQAAASQRNMEKEFRVRNIAISTNGISVVFADTIGTMKKIQEFVAWFYPLLAEHGASGAEICAECGTAITQGKWVMINGKAHHFHESCASRVKDEIQMNNENQKLEATGSYASGAVGAVLGAVLGAVVWAIVLCMGYVASLVGLLIGWLADKGYNLLKGKQGKAKVAILILAVIIGVIVGTLGGYALSFVMIINEGGTNLTYGDIPMLMMVLLTDEELVGEVIVAILQGLLFAALGVIGIVMQTNKAVSGTKVVDLE